MSEEGGEEGSIITKDMNKPLEEREIGPTSFDVTEGLGSIGPNSIDVTVEQASILETPPAEQREEIVQEQNKQIEQAQDESKIFKRKQKRRMTYLSNILKQVEKHGNQLNKMAVMIQSLQVQKRTKPTVDTGISKLQFQSTKQIQSQISQLQKQVTRIQKDIQRINTTLSKRANTRLIKSSSTTGSKSRSKKSKSLKTSKAKKSSKKVR